MGDPRLYRSYSAREHRYVRRCFDGCAGRSVDDWNLLARRVEAFRAENRTLRSDYAAVSQENQRLSAQNEHLLNDNIRLSDRNATQDAHNGHFTRRIADQEREIRQKDREIRHLRQDNDNLTNRTRELVRDKSALADADRQSRATNVILTNRYDQLARDRADDITVKDGVIRRLQRTIDRLERSLRGENIWPG